MSSATASSGYSNLFTPFPNLKGISPGVEKPKVEKGTLEKLLEIYEEVKMEYKFSRCSSWGWDVESTKIYGVEDNKLKSLLSEIDYCEKDISNLVATAQTWDLDENESKAFGAYVGSLITILTERNEAKGKRTIIKIDENRLDYLGYFCRKFDIVKFGVNNGNHVFVCARDGNELYVERSEGDDFAPYAGAYGGHVGEIRTDTVNGHGFAWLAGLHGYVGEISIGSHGRNAKPK